MSISPIRVLLLFVLMQVGFLGWLWVDPSGQLRSPVWLAPSAISPDMKMPASASKAEPMGGEASIAGILERPLFAPDRRPPPPPVPPPPPPPPDPLADIRILGIFSGETAGILARIDDKLRRVKLNDAVGLWMLKSIEGREIVFVQGDQTRRLKMPYAKLGVQNPAAIAAKAPPAARDNVPLGGAPLQNSQDETRDRIRRLNEYRASIGEPPLNYP